MNHDTMKDAGSHLAPLQILFRLEEIYNVIVEIQFNDGCMVKTLLRRKKQEFICFIESVTHRI